MTESAYIPFSLDEAIERLVAIEGIVTARGWERAAIVWAFTLPDDVDQVGTIPQKISFRAFAARRIAGLRDHHTVAKYHDAWQAAIDSGDAKPVVPGDRIEIPDLPWPHPAYKEARLGGDRRAAIEAVVGESGPSVASVAQVMEQPSAIAAAIRANPELAAIAEQAVRDRRREHPSERSPASQILKEPKPIPLIWMGDVTQVVRDVDRVVAGGAMIGHLDDEAVGLVNEAATRLETAAGWLRTLVRGEQISDDALHSWLGEGGAA